MSIPSNTRLKFSQAMLIYMLYTCWYMLYWLLIVIASVISMMCIYAVYHLLNPSHTPLKELITNLKNLRDTYFYTFQSINYVFHVLLTKRTITKTLRYRFPGFQIISVPKQLTWIMSGMFYVIALICGLSSFFEENAVLFVMNLFKINLSGLLAITVLINIWVMLFSILIQTYCLYLLINKNLNKIKIVATDCQTYKKLKTTILVTAIFICLMGLQLTREILQ